MRKITALAETKINSRHGSQMKPFSGRTVITAIERFLGKTGINVMTRIMALIVAAIGLNFIMTGLRSELPGVAG
ncbi:MarC family protein [Bradyrhizobium brasilense]|uniref:MarC family protein n=1 Tax=Bradyrhizobium brasilense TaxID=1419277 RepID=UPI001E3D4C0B|nr:MarC family protein [Bradyrhizobium brasilense]